MKLTDRILNKSFDAPMNTHLWSKYEEYTALAILKFCYAELYTHLCLADAPDLQDVDNSVGIEVVSSLSPSERKAIGELLKYPTMQTEKQKKKCKEKIDQYMECFDVYSALFPIRTLVDEKEEIVHAFLKKTEKAKTYQAKGFKSMGLLIYHPRFIFPETEEFFADWIDAAAKNANAQFDFVYIVPQTSMYNTGVLCYRCVSKKISSVRISPKDRQALDALARMTAEGEIKLDDPEWL